MNRFPVLYIEEEVLFPLNSLPYILNKGHEILIIERAMDNFNGKLVVIPSGISNLEREFSTIAEVVSLDETARGIRIVLQGEDRCRIKSIRETRGVPFADVEIVFEEIEDYRKALALSRAVKRLLLEFTALSEAERAPGIEALVQENDPVTFLYRTLSAIPLNNNVKWHIYQLEGIETKLDKILEAISTDLEVARLEKEILDKVKDRLSKNQKQYLLHEQLKVIQKELGREEDEDIQKLKETIEKSNMPDEAREKALSELERLKKIPPMSPESVVIRNYLDWLLKLPWNNGKQEEMDIKKVQEVLEKNHYGLEKVKETIIEYLSVLKLTGSSKGHILCFVGPPGVGKTSLGRSIAEALGRKFVRASLGGVKDEAEIRGHRRTYVGSMPGKIIQEIARAGVNNPVFLLDEVDKIGVDYRGDPASALLEVLDPEVNQSFMDHYIEIGYDLSHVLFITTANVTYSIPPPLLDRMEIINLPGYLEFEKIEIAKRHLIPKIIEDTGLRQRDFRVSDGVIKKIIKEYTQEAGVRNLERSLRKIARKIAREKAFGSRRISRITIKNIEDFLGVPKFKGFKKKQGVGVATGLAWTPVGGEVMQVETRVMDGEGNLILTGQMGDVMKESAMAALSVIRSNYKKYGLNKDFYRKLDVHVHIPEGAVPKDGPSAGVTIFSSILSALTKKQTKGDVAMTGEITLSGRILGVGGLTAKLMAARSAGVKNVILPLDNERDIKEVPEAVKTGLNLIFVKNTEDVVENAF